MGEVKTCKTCGVTKERKRFYKNSGMADGREGNCKACRRATIRERYQHDPEHREIHNRRCMARQAERYNNDEAYRLTSLLRCRMRSALDGRSKAGKSIELLGCTPEYLKQHLESLFTDGMAWGQKGLWHCDHILPVTAFDLTDEKQQRYAFHWSNLQPLSAEANLCKSDKYCPDELEAYLKSELPEPL